MGPGASPHPLTSNAPALDGRYRRCLLLPALGASRRLVFMFGVLIVVMVTYLAISRVDVQGI